MQESITEITSSLDWPDIETQIRTLGKTAPEFKFDIAKFTRCEHLNACFKYLSRHHSILKDKNLLTIKMSFDYERVR